MYTLKIEGADGSVNTLDEIDSLKLAIRIAGMAEKNEEQVNIYDDRNNLVWASNDSPALKRYTELDHEQWQSLTHGSHETSDKPSVYFDIDGTLGKWYADGRGLSLEEMIDPANHYFRDIEPIDYMVNLAQYLSEQGVDVCVISAAYKDTIRDKWDWIQEYLPFIPEENICFAPIGADKTDFVKGNADISILIDDYNKNLEQWKGVAVKALNGINSHSETFKSIDLYSVDKSTDEMVANADELLTEGRMPETVYDNVLYKAASRMSSAIKSEGNHILDMVQDLHSLKETYEFNYQLLGRLKSDCDYYLGMGNRNPDKLWAKNEIDQITKMLEIYDSLPQKPEWLTKEQILDYSEKMNVPALEAYEKYKAQWVRENIDDITFTQTQALYENAEDAKDMTFNEYVQVHGFADGSCYETFNEFCDNEYKIQRLAERIEEFMFDRGEYDFTPSERPRWLQIDGADCYAVYTGDTEGVGVSRETAVTNIALDLEVKDVDALIRYLESESNVMDEEDELVPVAEQLREEIIEHAYGSEQAYINAKNEQDKNKRYHFNKPRFEKGE